MLVVAASGVRPVEASLMAAMRRARSCLAKLLEGLRGTGGVLLLVGDLCYSRLVEEALSSWDGAILGVPGALDDHHVARVLEESGALLEGGPRYLGGGVHAGAVSGREPAGSAKALLEAGRLELLASYLPPPQLAQLRGEQAWTSELVGKIIESTAPALVVVGSLCPSPNAARFGETVLLCPGTLSEGCAGVAELRDGAVERAGVLCLAEPERYCAA
jgi:Icc-related predicted phosphoesterase